MPQSLNILLLHYIIFYLRMWGAPQGIGFPIFSKSFDSLIAML